MWRCQVALLLLLASPASAWTQETFIVLGDSFTQNNGDAPFTRYFAPFYKDIFKSYGFNHANHGAGGTTTCESVDPNFNDMGTDDLTAAFDAVIADGPYFAATLQWSHNDRTYSSLATPATDAQGAANFDHCYRLIIEALVPITRYIFINSAAGNTPVEYDNVIRQIILDFPSVYLGSEIFLDPDLADHVKDLPGDDPHPNDAGSIFWTDELDAAIGRTISINAGRYRKARR